MGRPRLIIRLTPGARNALTRARAAGDARQRKLACLVLLIASSSGYREAVAQSGLSSCTAVSAMKRYRQGGLQALFKEARHRGRPSRMNSPTVKEHLIRWLATVGAVGGSEVVAELRRAFKIKLRPDSLPRWLRKWGLKLPVPPRKVRTVPPVSMPADVRAFIQSEEDRVRKALSVKPTRSVLQRKLLTQQDQLELLSLIHDGGHSQTALAEYFARSPNSINRWLRAFHAAGGEIAGVKAMLALADRTQHS